MAPELMSVLLQQLKTVLAKQSNKERFRKLMLSKKATKEKAAPVRSLRLPTGVAGAGVAEAEKPGTEALTYTDEENSSPGVLNVWAEFCISPEPQAGNINSINIMHNSSAVSFKACFSIIISSFAGY